MVQMVFVPFDDGSWPRDNALLSLKIRASILSSRQDAYYWQKICCQRYLTRCYQDLPVFAEMLSSTVSIGPEESGLLRIRFNLSAVARVRRSTLLSVLE